MSANLRKLLRDNARPESLVLEVQKHNNELKTLVDKLHKKIHEFRGVFNKTGKLPLYDSLAKALAQLTTAEALRAHTDTLRSEWTERNIKIGFPEMEHLSTLDFMLQHIQQFIFFARDKLQIAKSAVPATSPTASVSDSAAPTTSAASASVSDSAAPSTSRLERLNECLVHSFYNAIAGRMINCREKHCDAHLFQVALKDFSSNIRVIICDNDSQLLQCHHFLYQVNEIHSYFRGRGNYPDKASDHIYGKMQVFFLSAIGFESTFSVDVNNVEGALCWSECTKDAIFHYHRLDLRAHSAIANDAGDNFTKVRVVVFAQKVKLKLLLS